MDQSELIKLLLVNLVASLLKIHDEIFKINLDYYLTRFVVHCFFRYLFLFLILNYYDINCFRLLNLV